MAGLQHLQWPAITVGLRVSGTEVNRLTFRRHELEIGCLVAGVEDLREDPGLTAGLRRGKRAVVVLFYGLDDFLGIGLYGQRNTFMPSTKCMLTNIIEPGLLPEKSFDQRPRSQRSSRSWAASQRAGSVINIASTLAWQGAAGNIGYGTSKGAVLQFTRAAAMDLAPVRHPRQ